MLDLIKFDSEEANVRRAAMKAVVAFYNFHVINMARTSILQSRKAVPEDVETVNHVDNYDEAAKDAAERAQADEVREEQGYATREKPEVLASLLKIIAEHYYDELLANASEERSIATGKTRVSPFDVGNTVAEQLKRMINREIRYDEEAIQAKADFLGVPPDRIRMIMKNGQQKEQDWLRENQLDVLEIANNLHWEGEPISVEQAIDRLPALTYLRLLASVDRSLLSLRNARLETYLIKVRPGSLLAAEFEADFHFTDVMRNRIQDFAEELVKNPTFSRELNNALLNGAAEPRFEMRPAVRLSKPKVLKVA